MGRFVVMYKSHGRWWFVPANALAVGTGELQEAKLFESYEAAKRAARDCKAHPAAVLQVRASIEATEFVEAE